MELEYRSRSSIGPREIKNYLEQECAPGKNRVWPIPNDTREYRLQSMGLYDKLDGLIAEGDTVIEAGCSTGMTTEELRERYPGADVIGVDVMDSFSENGEYVQAGATLLPFQDDTVDHVIAPNSLGRLVNKGLLKKIGGEDTTEAYVDAVLSEFGSVTTTRGSFLLADGEQGATYLHARNTGDGLTLEETCTFEGLFRDRVAEYQYEDWMESDGLDTSSYDRVTMRADDV